MINAFHIKLHFQLPPTGMRVTFSLLMMLSLIYLTFAIFRSLLTDLYRTICLCVKELMKNNPEQPVCLVMDDFSLLLSLGLQLQELVKFVHQCHFLLCTTVGYCKVSFSFFHISK